MTNLTEHTRKYWKYEYDVSARFMVPLLRTWGVPLDGARVLDIGCAEGGGVCALYDQGATCLGFDIDVQRIRAAAELAGERTIEFGTGNLYLDPVPYASRQFDLVVLHDVFEHLDRKEEMLEKLRRYLSPRGRLLITFPPYFSAYGAHQQLLLTPYARAPFIHLLPRFRTAILSRLKNENPDFVEEVRKLTRLKMGMTSFEKLVATGSLRIERKKAYLIGPNHIRFGLRPVPAGPFSKIPLAKEFLCSGVVYLLAPK
jgi:SAM-dependent methyltransferase